MGNVLWYIKEKMLKLLIHCANTLIRVEDYHIYSDLKFSYCIDTSYVVGELRGVVIHQT